PAQHIDQSGLVERRIGIRRTGEARYAAGDRRLHLGLERRLVFETRLAQPRRDIDEARRRHQPLGIDRALRAGELLADLAVGDVQVALAVPAARRVDDVRVLDRELHQLPATMLITAMRTAMPKVTCGRITECGPSATDESISTPRFIGPGCMTMASLCARASFSAVRP